MEKYKLSEELKFILGGSLEYSNHLGRATISTEVFLFHVLEHYSRDNDNLESGTIKALLSDLGDKILELKSDVYDYLTKSEGRLRDYLSQFIDKTNLGLSKELGGIFEKAATKRLLDFGALLVGKQQDPVLRTEDIFISIFGERNLNIVKMINTKYGITIDKIMNYRMINQAKDFCEKNLGFKMSSDSDMEDFERAGKGDDAISTKRRNPNSKTPVLDEFSVDMTKKAKSGGYDPVVGRDKEIKAMCEILCCRKKNNVILLGDPGAGKTALVELLSQKISKGEVPIDLRGKRILSISTTDLTSGTMYRGQLEQRVQALCSELAENRDIILYIDEFQQATSDNSTSIAQMLKPALGRGEITLIASTTQNEYRKFIEKDGALKRRFSPIQVDEPDIEETVKILEGLKDKYGRFHKVKYEAGLMGKIAEWSGKYISDRYFPDKAISVLDMASSMKKLGTPIDTTQVDNLESAIKEEEKYIRDAVLATRYEDAASHKSVKKALIAKLEETKKNLERGDSKNWPIVSMNEVASVISDLSNVPIDKIVSTDMEKLREMKTSFSKKVIGQGEAITELCMALQRNTLGLRDTKRPIASFLFLGPTGTGKTLSAQLLASDYFGSSKNLLTIACSEFTQEFSESSLIGSSAGYIGYDDKPKLYELKRKPYSVVLVDEFEKASKNFQNVFLNMLDEGEVTLRSGEVVSCRNCIFIFTSNTGTKSLEIHGAGLGFSVPGEDKNSKSREIVMKEVKNTFRPEFLNRLSKVVVFNSLGTDELKEIYEIELGKLKDRLGDYKITVSEGIKDLVISKCEPQYGARSLKRLIEENIEQEICKYMLDNDTTGKKKVDIDYKDSQVIVKFRK